MKKYTTDLKVGEVLVIGDATVRLEKKSGQLARLVVTADAGTPICTMQERREIANQARKSALQHQ